MLSPERSRQPHRAEPYGLDLKTSHDQKFDALADDAGIVTTGADQDIDDLGEVDRRDRGVRMSMKKLFHLRSGWFVHEESDQRRCVQDRQGLRLRYPNLRSSASASSSRN